MSVLLPPPDQSEVAMSHPPRPIEVGPNMRLVTTGATLLAVVAFAFQVGQWKTNQDLLHDRVTRLEQERAMLADAIVALKQEVLALRVTLDELRKPALSLPPTTYARGSK